MDIVTYALSKKYADSIASDITNITTDGNEIYFTTSGGTTFTVTLNSVASLNVSGSGHLIVTLTNGDTIDAGALPVGTMDTALSATSENGVQNKVITAALNGKQNTLTAGTAITIDNTDPAAPVISANNDYTNLVNKPTALSAFTNDQGFITNTVNNLTNYYLKTATYSATEIDTLISNLHSLTVEIVETLPESDISTHTIYLVNITGTNNYNQWMYINNAWSNIGSTSVDLTNYYTKTQTDTLLDDKVDKVTGYGLSQENFTSAYKAQLDNYTVDTILDSTSSNPIANSAVTDGLDAKQNKTLTTSLVIDGTTTTTVEAALSNLNAYANKKLTITSTIPVSPSNGDVILYTGTSTADYKQGSVYQYQVSEWVLITANSDPVTKYNYSMAGTASIKDDIKTFVTALIALGANTYAGYFNRSGNLGTAGNYCITVYANEGTSTFATGYIILGAGAMGKVQYEVSYYKPVGSSEDWVIKKLITESDTAKRKDVAVTATASIENDIKTLLDELIVETSGPYIGSFTRTGNTSGHYSVSVSNTWNVMGIVSICGATSAAYRVAKFKNTAQGAYTYIIEKLVTENEATLRHPISVPVESGTAFSNVWDALLYQLIHTDWTFLTSSDWNSASGGYELQGHYWGEYCATHTTTNNVVVTGTITWGATPHTFSAMHDPTVPAWKISINGEELMYSANNIAVTKDTSTGRRIFVKNTGDTNIGALYNALQACDLINRPSTGIFNWTIEQTRTCNLGTPYNANHWTTTVTAGELSYFQNPRVSAINSANSEWWLFWSDGNVYGSCNMWGETSPLCTYIALEYII